MQYSNVCTAGINCIFGFFQTYTDKIYLFTNDSCMNLIFEADRCLIYLLQLIITIVFYDSIWIKANKNITRSLVTQLKTIQEVYTNDKKI